jgi:hypothetical protein
MDDSSYRLNFDLGKKNKIHHHSEKEHVKISKIAKFGREMLQNAEKYSPTKFANFVLIFITHGKMHQHLGRKWCIFPCVIQINTKFANFVGIYFPHFTTFRNQTL